MIIGKLKNIRLKHYLSMLIMLVGITACTSDITNIAGINDITMDANASSEFYLAKAEQTSDQNKRTNYLLLASRVMLQENKLQQAESILTELPILSPAQQLDKDLLEAQIYVARHDLSQANRKIKQINLNALSSSQTARYYDVIAKIFEQQGDELNATRIKIKQLNFITDHNRRQENINQTWKLINNLDSMALEQINFMNNEYELYAWVALAKIYKENLATPENLNHAIIGWKNVNPSHPAAISMPTSLASLATYQAQAVKHIALLLPLSGNAKTLGSIIRTGFQDASDNSGVKVTVFDTMHKSVDQILEEIQATDVDTVVGPLLKQNVTAILNNFNLRDFNVLTLNTVPQNHGIGSVCSFSLSPESEAYAAAERMWQKRIKHPVLIMVNNDLGIRSTNAFTQRWQQLAGDTPNRIMFTNKDDLTDIVSRTLGFDNFEGKDTTATTNTQSKMNISQLNIDVDGFYFIGSNTELALMKNTLIGNKFTYRLPIYTSSRTNTSNNNVDFRTEMENVIFSDIPFLQKTGSNIYKRASNIAKKDLSLIRLYAMGHDAWKLSTSLSELRYIPDFKVDGLTGQLTAGDNCDIDRNISWFQYKQGIINMID